MAFRRFGTFKTPDGWQGIDGEGRIFQRGLKREGVGENFVPDKPLQAYLSESLIKVSFGTIGNKVPTINGTAISNTSIGFSIPADDYYFLIADCPASNSGNVSFPSGVPVLTLETSVPSDTNTSGKIVMASVDVYNEGQSVEIANNLSGSLWGERLKVTGSTATYFFNAI